MLNRWAVVFFLSGSLLGYAFAARPVSAQAEPYPFAVGDQITLTYENERSYVCVVGEFHGGYLRCDPYRITSIGRGARTERWVSLERIVSIEKHRN
jgi:hypothetical protein